MSKQAIAVIDSSHPSLFIYDVPNEWDSDRIEQFIHDEGHKLSNCSWGAFDGEIQDFRTTRSEYNEEEQ